MQPNDDLVYHASSTGSKGASSSIAASPRPALALTGQRRGRRGCSPDGSSARARYGFSETVARRDGPGPDETERRRRGADGPEQEARRAWIAGDARERPAREARQRAHPEIESGAEQRHVDETEVRRRQPREHQRGQRAAARQAVNDADDSGRSARVRRATWTCAGGPACWCGTPACACSQGDPPSALRSARPRRPAGRAQSASPRRRARTRRPARQASPQPATRGRGRSRAAPPRDRCPTAPRAARPAGGPARPPRARDGGEVVGISA